MVVAVGGGTGAGGGGGVARGRVSQRLPMVGPTPMSTPWGLGRIWDFGKAHQVNCCGRVMGLVLIGESILRTCFSRNKIDNPNDLVSYFYLYVIRD